MAQQQITGAGLMYPKLPTWVTPPTLNAGLLIDATGEKAAMSGRVWFPARTGSKNISRVAFMFGAVTKAGGSALTVSLQDVSLTSGPPMQPDGSQDQTVAIANADASFLSNTWYRTGTFSASRSVTYGDRLSVVIEYDGGGRKGADSVIINSESAAGTSVVWMDCVASLFTGSWARQDVFPMVVLEFDDGTFGTLDGAAVWSAINQHNFNSGTLVSDEYAVVINVPWACKVDGLWALAQVGSSADFELLLYSGTTALATVTVDANAILATGGFRPIMVPIAELSLSANTDYYVALRPTTANNIVVVSLDVADANHWTTQDGGTAIQFTTRLDQGSWAAKTATRRLFAGVRISSLDDGSAGGGLLTHPGLAGGMRG